MCGAFRRDVIELLKPEQISWMLTSTSRTPVLSFLTDFGEPAIEIDSFLMMKGESFARGYSLLQDSITRNCGKPFVDSIGAESFSKCPCGRFLFGLSMVWYFWFIICDPDSPWSPTKGTWLVERSIQLCMSGLLPKWRTRALLTK